MKLLQYGNYFYLYISFCMLIPAIIAGFCGKKLKYYGILCSLVMIMCIMGNAWQIKQFAMFFVFESVLVILYLFIRRKSDNKYLYFIFLFLSIIPLIIIKIAGVTKYSSAIGFLGISYINFRTIQMIIEIYDGRIKDINIGTYIYFVIFFPTLSSGPIDRWIRFEKDLNSGYNKGEYFDEYLLVGIQKIALAVLYKFVIAYIISTYYMPGLLYGENTVINAIKYMYVYTMYLFFDFAGYSLFAVGTSYILGIKTPDNFKLPFISKDMKEFWTRWHISLSRWFGDYIFSRLVLNFMRKKIFKNRFRASHTAQIITMLVMGFWHGITPYYILYGLYQGIVLVLTDIYQRKSKFYKKHKKEKWFQAVEIFCTFQIIAFGMFIFSGYSFLKK